MKQWFFLLFLGFIAVTCQATPLPAEEIFTTQVDKVDPNTFSITWHIKPGYFLYKDKISLEQPSDNILKLGPIRLPQAQLKKDRQGQVYQVYRNELTVPISILGVRPGEELLQVHYQGCADDGFCYPPQTQDIKVSINDKLALSEVVLEGDNDTQTSSQALEEDNDHIAGLYANSHWFMVIVSFFGFGLLLAFTPCVLPMVPVLSGIIIGHGHSISTRKAFLLSLSYVLSMSLTYALVGAVVALLGKNLQIIMQTSWVLAVFSLLFILLALSMFGYFELKLPVSWQAALAKASRSQSGGHYLSAAVMGCLSTLILSPCVTAPLIGALSYIAHSGNVIFGIITLFFLGLGMGTPLLLIGTSAGKWLPKAGLWMNSVKNFFGILLLGVAIYLMGRLLPPPITMILWACLLVFSGIFAGALSNAQTPHEKLHQSAGILLLVYGLLILAGASMGSRDPLLPLAGVFGSNATAANTSTAKKIKNLDELYQALSTAEGRPVLVDFYAAWCASCKVIENTTLTDVHVKELLNKFVILKVDVTANDAEDQQIMKEFDVVAPPTFLFFNSQGEELPTVRLVGDFSTEDFIKRLQKVLDLSETE